MIYSDFSHPYLKEFKERIDNEGFYTLEFSQSIALNNFLKFMTWAKPDSKYALYPLKKNMNMGRGTTALGIGDYGRLVPLELQFDDWTYSGMRFGLQDDIDSNGDGKNRYAYLDFTKIPLNTKYDITIVYMLRHAVPEKIQSFYHNSMSHHLSRDTYFCSDGSDQNYSIVAPYWSKNIGRARFGYTTLYDDQLGTELKGVQVQTQKSFDGDWEQNDTWDPPLYKSNGDDPFCISFNSRGTVPLNFYSDTAIHDFDEEGHLVENNEIDPSTQFRRVGSSYYLKTHSGSNSEIGFPWEPPISNVFEPFRLNFGLQQDIGQINTRYDGSKTPGLRHWAYAILVMSGFSKQDKVDLISKIMLETFDFNKDADMMYGEFGADAINPTAFLSGFSSWGEIRTGENVNLSSSISDFEERLIIKKSPIRNENIFASGYLSDLLERLVIKKTGFYEDIVSCSGYLSDFQYNAGSLIGDFMDQYWENVSLLMHMDGINNSTSFKDHSIYNHSSTPHEDVALSTGNPMFGTASMRFDGSGDFTRITGSDAFAFPNDFTVECFINFNTLNGEQGIIDSATSLSNANSPQWYLYKNISNDLVFGEHFSFSNKVFTWSPSPIAGQWYHIAVCREYGYIRVFVDGVQIGDSWLNTSSLNQGGLNIGAIAKPAPKVEGVMFVNHEVGVFNIYGSDMGDTQRFTNESSEFSISAVDFGDTQRFMAESGGFSISAVDFGDTQRFMAESGGFSISGLSLS